MRTELLVLLLVIISAAVQLVRASAISAAVYLNLFDAQERFQGHRKIIDTLEPHVHRFGRLVVLQRASLAVIVFACVAAVLRLGYYSPIESYGCAALATLGTALVAVPYLSLWRRRASDLDVEIKHMWWWADLLTATIGIIIIAASILYVHVK